MKKEGWLLQTKKQDKELLARVEKHLTKTIVKERKNSKVKTYTLIYFFAIYKEKKVIDKRKE